MSDASLVEQIAQARGRNFDLLKRLAALTKDPVGLGFVPRTASNDVTLRVISSALREAPYEARALLRRLAMNDLEVVLLTLELSGPSKSSVRSNWGVFGWVTIYLKHQA